MGSKDRIADEIMASLPNTENFFDLFGGGFAITHAAIVHKKAKHFHFNELTKGPVELVKRSIAGEFSYKRFRPQFISREDFIKNKDSDAYIRIVWSFGNNQRNYIFGKDIEAYKRSIHNAVIFDEFDETARSMLGIDKWPKGMKHPTNKRLLCRQLIKNRNQKIARERLQQLLQLEQLQQLEQLVKFSELDYRDVEIKGESIVYCDPPYLGTVKYTNEFNHNEFWKWARESKHPVFVSEYTTPDDFYKVASIHLKAALSGKGASRAKSTEKLVANKAAQELIFYSKKEAKWPSEDQSPNISIK